MSARRRTITMRIIGSNTVEASGSEALRSALDGIPSQQRHRSVWLAPTAYADQIEERLLAAGHVVEWCL